MSAPHSFQALAFPENVPLRALSALFPNAIKGTHELRVAIADGGTLFLYPFGVVVFEDVDPAVRERQLEALRKAEPRLARAGRGPPSARRGDGAGDGGRRAA